MVLANIALNSCILTFEFIHVRRQLLNHITLFSVWVGVIRIGHGSEDKPASVHNLFWECVCVCVSAAFIYLF